MTLPTIARGARVPYMNARYVVLKLGIRGRRVGNALDYTSGQARRIRAELRRIAAYRKAGKKAPDAREGKR